MNSETTIDAKKTFFAFFFNFRHVFTFFKVFFYFSNVFILKKRNWQSSQRQAD